MVHAVLAYAQPGSFNYLTLISNRLFYLTNLQLSWNTPALLVLVTFMIAVIGVSKLKSPRLYLLTFYYVANRKFRLFFCIVLLAIFAQNLDQARAFTRNARQNAIGQDENSWKMLVDTKLPTTYLIACPPTRDYKKNQYLQPWLPWVPGTKSAEDSKNSSSVIGIYPIGASSFHTFPSLQ